MSDQIISLYLPPGLPAGLSDAWANVDGVHLPLHSQVRWTGGRSGEAGLRAWPVASAWPARSRPCCC